MARAFEGELRRTGDNTWEIPQNYKKGMRVPGIIYSSETMINDVMHDNAPEQVANAAHLPGIVEASMAMPDIHWGYGLPIGGVVATDIDNGGVITPGGVGYDINCGVRLLRTALTEEDIRPELERVVNALFSSIPTGVGSKGKIKAGRKELRSIFTKGARWAVEKGYGEEEDLEFCEAGGALEGADPDAVSSRAYERGEKQPGTLGSGNHFLEVQVVDRVYDPEIAGIYGIEEGSVTVMIHTGSRGLGHQICGDYAKDMVKLLQKYDINIPDRQLACVPVKSAEGKAYLGAMRCAANYAWNNRQIIMHITRECFERVFGEGPSSLDMGLVYDVAHNVAKIEEYDISGEKKRLCVHRKGATRAFPPGHEELPEQYKNAGQPVIIPGDMGRFSFLLSGTEEAEKTFYSTCHGAGRKMSRTAAKKATGNRSISRELEDKGILVRYSGRDTLHEEVSEAYKDVNEVVQVVHDAGISNMVARMKPLCVIKG
jgi:tRNA-splicing ligase RtcB